MIAVALATTHQAHEPGAGLMAEGLPALSALVTGGGVVISGHRMRMSAAVHDADSAGR